MCPINVQLTLRHLEVRVSQPGSYSMVDLEDPVTLLQIFNPQDLTIFHIDDPKLLAFILGDVPVPEFSRHLSLDPALLTQARLYEFLSQCPQVTHLTVLHGCCQGDSTFTVPIPISFLPVLKDLTIPPLMFTSFLGTEGSRAIERNVHHHDFRSRVNVPL